MLDLDHECTKKRGKIEGNLSLENAAKGICEKVQSAKPTRSVSEVNSTLKVK